MDTTDTLPFVELMKKVNDLPDNLRYGQRVFNVISEMNPVLASVLAGTKHDCFYDDSKVDDFIKMCTMFWDIEDGVELAEGSVEVIIERYDPEVTEPPFSFITLDRVSLPKDVFATSDGHHRLFNKIAKIRGYQYRFWSIDRSNADICYRINVS